MSEHKCVFVEEREPSGRLIVGPCLECNLSAFDALKQARQAAIAEVVRTIRARGNVYMRDCQAKDATGKKYRDPYELRRVNSGRAWAFKDLADELDGGKGVQGGK